MGHSPRSTRFEDRICVVRLSVLFILGGLLQAFLLPPHLTHSPSPPPAFARPPGFKMRFTRLLLSQARAGKSLEGLFEMRNSTASMQGSTWKSLKPHSGLYPLFIMGAGMTFVTAYIIRLSTKTTDIQWRRNPEAFDYYKDKNFKFFSPGPLPTHHGERVALVGPSKTNPSDYEGLGKVVQDQVESYKK